MLHVSMCSSMFLLLFLPSALTQQNSTPAFCNSSIIVKFLQTLQLERARNELGMRKSAGHRPDLDFYSYSYGVTTVDGVGSETAIKTVSGPSLIIYYNIYQNANEYIQSLLRNFADVLSFHYREYSAYLDVTDAEEASPAYVPFKMFRSNLIRRHSFTFVRDPIARFISGYATITMSQQQLMQGQRRENRRDHPQQQEKRSDDVHKTAGQEEHKEGQSMEGVRKTEDASVLIGLEDKLSSESQLSGPMQGSVDQREGHKDYMDVLDLALEAGEEAGSVAHVQAFIRYLLQFQGSSNGGKGKGFLRNPNHPLAPIFPQIGTLLRAAEVEKGGGRIRLYQYEQFEEEWGRMSNNSGYAKWMNLAFLMETNRVPPHNYNSLDPSNDALNTIVRASNRLFGRNEDEYLDLDMYPLALDPLHTEEEQRAAALSLPHRIDPQVKRQYTRALCRIYLTDYVCTHQPLPEACRDDLYNEVERDLLAYKSTMQQHSLSVQYQLFNYFSWLHPRAFVPQWLLLILVEIPCAFANNPPECVVSFVYGLSPGDPEDEDDGPFSHDEL